MALYIIIEFQSIDEKYLLAYDVLVHLEMEMEMDLSRLGRVCIIWVGGALVLARLESKASTVKLAFLVQMLALVITTQQR